eukprot:m.430375 g.430375  ORF g.430375 m.430375 type:complete len:368 (+) comp17153_c0_seq1:1764-2867(+)
MAGAQVIRDLLEDTPEAREAMAKVFIAMDPNGNQVLSLAEVHKYMEETWPEFDSQRMLIRAHSAADSDGSGWITFPEFRKMLKYVLFFDELYDKFVSLDKDGDHRLTEEEFVKGCEVVGGDKIEDPAAAFHAMDQNDGGVVLFDEFSVWIARKLCVDGEGVDEQTYIDAYKGSLGAITAADGGRVRSGAWWKGRAKLNAMTKKKDKKAKEQRKKLYARIDADGSRGVTPDEVYAAVQKMWPEFDSMEAVNSAFKAADRSGEGRVQFREFRLLIKYLLFFDNAWDLFKQMDTNADGKLQLEEFSLGMQLLSLKEEAGDAETEYAKMNVDEGKGVELDEFALWLANHSNAGDDMAEDLARVADSDSEGE